MKLLPFMIVMLGCLHGTKLLFLGVKFGLYGDSVMMLNLVIIGLCLIVFPMYLIEEVKNEV